MKHIINIHFFEKVLKPSADLNKMWLLIDERKILSGTKDLISAVHQICMIIKQNACNKLMIQLMLQQLKPTFQSKIWCSLGKYRYKSIIEKYCIPQ
jgi:hypothetical protein